MSSADIWRFIVSTCMIGFVFVFTMINLFFDPKGKIDDSILTFYKDNLGKLLWFSLVMFGLGAAGEMIDKFV